MCLLHEATPTNYALVRKACTVQMHILMCTQTLFNHPYGSVTEARLEVGDAPTFHIGYWLLSLMDY